MEIINNVSKIKDNPLISIIVPAYNVEPYLSRCLDSILGQSYQNIEIIVVDDGATDKSGEIADKYAIQYPEKIKSIRTENHGVTTARLTGVENASGEWIGFVDGDDQIEPDMYQRLVDNALKYSADISHCGYKTIVNDGERIHYFYDTGRLVQQDKLTGMKDLLGGSFVEPSLCNKLFHKTLFQSLLYEDVMDKTLRVNEDLVMNYILFRSAKKSVYEDFCPYSYMARNTSVTRAGFQLYKTMDSVRARKWILDNAECGVEGIAWRKYLITCYGAYNTVSFIKKYRNEVKALKKELISNRDKWVYLTNKERIRLLSILFLPNLYRAVYSIYQRFFQHKVYE